jgi:hypothetical protein
MSTLKRLIKPFLIFAMAIIKKSPFLHRVALGFVSLFPSLKSRLASVHHNNQQLINLSLKQIIKEYIKRLLLKAMNFVIARPTLKKICLRIIDRFPMLGKRLRRILMSRQAPSTFILPTVNLSPLAQQYYSRLRAAVLRAQEKASCE